MPDQPTRKHERGVVTRSQAIPNEGLAFYPEQHPADPLKDELTKVMTHRGGLADPRTEHY